MKFVIVYESMFGNTRQIAEAIRDGIADVSLVSVVNVNEMTPMILANSDVVLVGAPTRVHGLSRPSTRVKAAEEAAEPARGLILESAAMGIGVREWLAGKPALPRHFAAFDTRVDVAHIVSGAASTKIDRTLRGLGAQRLAPAESFLVDRQNHLDVDERPRARAWGAALARAAQVSASALRLV